MKFYYEEGREVEKVRIGMLNCVEVVRDLLWVLGEELIVSEFFPYLS